MIHTGFLFGLIFDPDDGGEMFLGFGFHGTTIFSPLHLMMNIDPISETFYLEKELKTTDYVQNNSHVYWNIQSSKKFTLNEKVDVLMQTGLGRVCSKI
jgi:hypothetical protein